MKSCLICRSADQADAVPTCPACGEASWSSPGIAILGAPDTRTTPITVPLQADDVVITDDATVEKTGKKRKKP